jgi:acid phosphatase type 7
MKYLGASFILLFSLQVNSQNSSQTYFLVKPYLQIGNAPTPQSLQLLWHTTEANAEWLVEYKTGSADWVKSGKQTFSKVAVTGIESFLVYKAPFTSLTSGSLFTYRVSKNGKVVFNAEAKAPRSFEQPYRFVVSGDMGAGTKAASQVANGIYKSNADFVAIAGDIVYSQGLISEYKTKFWPIYNADKVDSTGVPLMSSVPFVAAVGNHDADTRDLDRFPGALAYYHFWDQPLNGPVGKEGGPLLPLLKASDANRKAFLDGAADKYPRMTNFSFDYGNAHWTVIDSDNYVDWTDSTLKDWVAKDLEKAKNASWRFVMFHHPGFNSSRAHYEQQQMRLLAPIFEKGNVDLVFSGHVHNYQRSFPMSFVADRTGIPLFGGTDNKVARGRLVTGRWTLDKKFDGKRNKKPNGVIYIVTGAGGQGLYNPEQQKDTDSWQKFTDKFVSTIHSFTVVDVNGNTLTLRQVDVNGKEVDKFQIIK